MHVIQQRNIVYQTLALTAKLSITQQGSDKHYVFTLLVQSLYCNARYKFLFHPFLFSCIIIVIN